MTFLLKQWPNCSSMLFYVLIPKIRLMCSTFQAEPSSLQLFWSQKSHFCSKKRIFVVIIWEIRTLSENSIFWSTMVFIHTAKSMLKTNQQRNGYKTVISKKTNYRIEQSIDENTMVFIAHHSYNAKRSMIRHFYIFHPWF